MKAYKDNQGQHEAFSSVFAQTAYLGIHHFIAERKQHLIAIPPDLQVQLLEFRQQTPNSLEQPRTPSLLLHLLRRPLILDSVRPRWRTVYAQRLG